MVSITRENLQKEKGITIIALVVTIIVLIILATITINGVFGENGLIKQAQDAQNLSENVTESQFSGMNSVYDEYSNMLAGPFEPTETPDPEPGAAEFTTRYGVIEIKWLSGTSNYVSTTPNAPKIKSISNGTMELVRYDEESQDWVAGSEYSYEKQTSTTENGGTSKWANARVTIDGVASYFVWIPRYAYRIVYFSDEASKEAYRAGTLTEAEAIESGKLVGYSDSRGIVNAEGKKVDGVASTTKTMVSKDYFMTHPAFTSDVDVGGFGEELEGIWIGKYETSLYNTETSTYVSTDLSTTGNILLSSTANRAIAVQPNMRSWRYITIGKMYTNARYYSEELESHMLKNSEWGAVAYLTESAYGRNGTEVTINNSMITGNAGNSISDSYASGITNAYNSEKGVLASSTGNVYGIYDLSGGVNERIAAYYNGEDAEHISYGSSFASIGGESDAYSTVYNTTGRYSSSYKQNYIYGDATYETADWHSDSANFVSSSIPFFSRGDSGSGGTGAGVFSFDYSSGDINIYVFRLALSVL